MLGDEGLTVDRISGTRLALKPYNARTSRFIDGAHIDQRPLRSNVPRLSLTYEVALDIVLDFLA